VIICRGGNADEPLLRSISTEPWVDVWFGGFVPVPMGIDPLASEPSMLYVKTIASSFGEV
jgi:hypothetical protein